ncbi:MAG: DNA polymerase III subunit alpha [Ferruginibacter sp.]|nr:DNA polymerase III subunit alpha [Cytophagales bacterium]
MPSFNHLHCHTQYSLLDGAASITGMMKKAQADGMRAVGLTDHGNMFGAFKFVAEANKYNVKPIVGCEFYLVEDRHRKTFSKDASSGLAAKDVRRHQLLLAKDHAGYVNLAKLCSLGFVEGFYLKYPRIDKALVAQYHHGLIATTCCIGAEVPQAILHEDEAAAEKKFRWWLDLFGEDYYVEIQRHKMDEQEKVNATLLKFAKKYGVKTIASNDSHYIDQADFNAHDILLCVNTGEVQSTPVYKGEGSTPRGHRFGFFNDQFYFKTQAEMGQLFHDLPQSLDYTNEIVDKITPPKLKRDILLPNFPLPAGFATADDYLKHLTFEGARVKYLGEEKNGDRTENATPSLLPPQGLPSEVVERLTHELHIVKTMGFAGYFLIVADFIRAGRDLGVMVGPGRGSAAGSAVAYCIGITNIDPIKYNLLFERFLNPERVSMPDIDTDFDDAGRQKVIDYVVEKYGKAQVAQIVTYGSMAAKTSIKDVARALELSLPEANALTKLVPEKPGTTLRSAYLDVPELRAIRDGNDLRATVLKTAEVLEGSVRNTGVHAAGVIIAPDDITNYIPVATSKESDLYVTQFDGRVIEEAGMLKMDFLGLKTLTIIKEALALIKKNHGVEIDIDDLPHDDPKTFALYQRGETVGTFQFESEGMRKYLKDLKPTNIEDLIAMNALYRPGPMDYIPSFIDRKQGREKIEYPHELLEPILKNTYGIMVYQEQIMQTAQVSAGYSLGGADLLRRAMGKKDREKMAKERVKFVQGAKEIHGIGKNKADEIFDVMEKFAEYGFNRSHSAAYSVVAFQTAYLKANYPGEYMSAVLTSWIGNIEKITFFMDECRATGIPVLGPDVNESASAFDVNRRGQIRFGLGAIKGAGEAAVEEIIRERNAGGPYQDFFDFARRVTLKSVNKKTFESLAYAGAFDGFADAQPGSAQYGGIHRAQYLVAPPGEKDNLIEKAIKYGTAYHVQKNATQHSLFGGAGGVDVLRPRIVPCEPWSEMERLKNEKDVVGFYISGHPLDQYRLELDNFCSCTLDQIDNFRTREVNVAGIVTRAVTRQAKNGNYFMIFTLEDYQGALEIALFNKDYVQFEREVVVDRFLYVKGRVELRWGSTDQYELKPTKIELLSEIREKMSKEIHIQIDVASLDAQLVSNLNALVQAHPGSCQLKMVIRDREEKIEVDMLSRKYKVSPSNELIRKLSEWQGVSYRLN